MPKLLIINSVCGIRSTGRICTDIAQEYKNKGYEVKIAYGRETVPDQYKEISYRIGNELLVKKNVISCRLFDNDAFSAKYQTKKFLKWADEFNPDILWLHNLHGYYINVEMLFAWIKSRPSMQVKWTLHDCWALTGHCSYFSFVGCDKWRSQCKDCQQKKQYPKSLILDNCQKNFTKKKAAFCGVKDLTIITVSHWLESLVKSSFLNEYPINVVYNNVNPAVYKHAPGKFRETMHLENKKIVLGVASVWDSRKGLTDFIKLADLLNEEYVIVLVGLSKKQIKKMPGNIIGIERTNCVDELVKIYSEADVFVNPSKEETFGLTTVEAKLCGTTPIVYEKTACEEVAQKYGGVVVKNDIESLYNAIIKTCAKENGNENRNSNLS